VKYFSAGLIGSVGWSGPEGKSLVISLLFINLHTLCTRVVPKEPAEKYFTTWEDYAKELHRISQADPTTENVAMADIADHNSGEIVEVEHYDKPITLSIAVNKNIGKRWSLETGLQYSYLKSYLILGTGSYRVDKEQKLHYLGVPFKLSYQFMKFKRLSTYGSVGTGILIPYRD
jgi:hypothetical protein